MRGIDKFKERFAGHDGEYVLIGGGACDLLFGEAGQDFRATKDLDLVLGGGADARVRPRLLGFRQGGRVREQAEEQRRAAVLPVLQAGGPGLPRHAGAV